MKDLIANTAIKRTRALYDYYIAKYIKPESKYLFQSPDVFVQMINLTDDKNALQDERKYDCADATTIYDPSHTRNNYTIAYNTWYKYDDDIVYEVRIEPQTVIHEFAHYIDMSDPRYDTGFGSVMKYDESPYTDEFYDWDDLLFNAYRRWFDKLYKVVKDSNIVYDKLFNETEPDVFMGICNLNLISHMSFSYFRACYISSCCYKQFNRRMSMMLPEHVIGYETLENKCFLVKEVCNEFMRLYCHETCK